MSSRRCLPRSQKALEESEVSTAVVETKKQESSLPVSNGSLFSQQDEDERIRSLETSGALSHVVGSQSILSQELQEHSMASSLPSSPGTMYFEQVIRDDPVIPPKMLLSSQTSMSQQDQQEQDQFDPPTPSKELVENISSSQLSCLLTAAREIESPLPSPAKPKAKKPVTRSATGKIPGNNPMPGPPPPLDGSMPTVPHPLASPPQPSPNKPLYQSPGKSTYPNFAQRYPTNHILPSPRSKSRKTRKLSKNRAEKEQELEQARVLAKQAADLAAQAIANPELSKQLLLKMVYCRTNPRSPPASWPPRGHVIEEGFFWGTYPPLEIKLKSFMRAYYELSMAKCQSKEQQAFNNDMVTMIRAEALKYDWTFSRNFSEKALRDRVRCYFKTHIQNAKKRLRTMLMNPTKKANTKALIEHLELLKNHANEEEEEVENSYPQEQVMVESSQDSVERVVRCCVMYVCCDVVHLKCISNILLALFTCYRWDLAFLSFLKILLATLRRCSGAGRASGMGILVSSVCIRNLREKVTRLL